VAVLPVGADTEQPDSFDLVELDLLVSELGRARQFAGESGLAGAFGAGAPPSKQLEVIGRLVPVGPLNCEEPSRPIGQDV
jgi:hypothetical protein